MYKKTLLLSLVLAVFFTDAQAQTKSANKKEKVTKEIPAEPVKATPPVEVKQTGPVGFGPIKFDMRKEELESLPTDNEVHLVAPLTVKDMKTTKLPEGKVWYDGQLKMPLATSPVKSTFVFFDGQLVYFSMELDEVQWKYMQKQISDKYGPGEIQDDQKEEQCIYKNGSNFKLTNGTKSVLWRQVTIGDQQITTSANDSQFGMCPFSLRDPMISVKTKSISFSRGPIKRDNSKSLF